MKNIIGLLAILSMIACSEQNVSQDNSTQRGQFKATLGDRQYQVDIGCSGFDQDYFTFLSDKTDVSDTNGDGLIISGYQMKNGKITLTINDKGTSFSHPGVMIEKSAKAANGAGTLFTEDTSKSLLLSYQLSCP